MILFSQPRRGPQHHSPSPCHAAHSLNCFFSSFPLLTGQVGVDWGQLLWEQWVVLRFCKKVGADTTKIARDVPALKIVLLGSHFMFYTIDHMEQIAQMLKLTVSIPHDRDVVPWAHTSNVVRADNDSFLFLFCVCVCVCECV